MESYPYFSYSGGKSPVASDGSFVCKRCHLREHSAGFITGGGIFPNQVLGLGVGFPRNRFLGKTRGIGGLVYASRVRGGYVGGVVALPEGFRPVPKSRLSEGVASKIGGLFVQPYYLRLEEGDVSGTETLGGLSIGPVAGVSANSIFFPVLSPGGEGSERGPSLGSYSFGLGVNVGRGQLYPDGTESSSGYCGFIPKTDGVVGMVVRDRARMIRLGVQMAAPAGESFAEGGAQSSESGIEGRRLSTWRTAFCGGSSARRLALRSGGSATACPKRVLLGPRKSEESPESQGTFKLQNRIRVLRCFGGGCGSLYRHLDCKTGVFIEPGLAGYCQGGLIVALQSVSIGRIVVGLICFGGLSLSCLVEKKKQFEKVQGDELLF
jgi:hypothetical protein